MAISVCLNPELAKVLERECKRQRKTRPVLIHEALVAMERIGNFNHASLMLADSERAIDLEKRDRGASVADLVLDVPSHKGTKPGEHHR